MSNSKSPKNGKSISELIDSALENASRIKLKDLGQVVQQTIKDIPSVQSSAQPWKPPKLSSPRIPRGLPQIILGSIATFFFGLLTLIFATMAATLQPAILYAGFSIALTVPTLLSFGVLIAGVKKRRFAARIISLIDLFKSKKVYTFKELTTKTGLPPKKIKRDIRGAWAKGLLSELRIDPDETCVMWGEEVYQQYLITEKARQQRLSDEEKRRQRMLDPATAGIELFRSEGEITVQKIRAANDAITGEEISAKLSALEDTASRIFTYVEQHPEKLPDTRRFMNYYLPTTLKLVEKYQQYDKMDFEPQNVRQAKRDIERSLDTINLAFGNLLESLFTHDTLDVTTDIDVLEKMLEQEGLTGDKFKINPPGLA